MLTSSYAHSGLDHGEIASWSKWNFDLPIVVALLCLGVLYLVSLRRVSSKKVFNLHVLKRSSSVYYLGLFSLWLALQSPIDTMSDVLSWAHMLQHTLILMVAAPLMVLGSPSFISLWLFKPAQWKKFKSLKKLVKWALSSKTLRHPLLAWLLYSVTIFLWHIPKFYTFALKNEFIHDLQHISFFITAYLFWWIIFDPIRKKNLSGVIAILYPFIASLHGIALGTFMVLSPKVWYQPYMKTAPLYGFSPLQDQQIAGLIMWMPAGLTYAFAAIFIIYSIFPVKSRQAEL